MPRVFSLNYKTPGNQDRTVRFLAELDPAGSKFFTTILTGRNGSNKSTILKDLVAALVGGNRKNITHSPLENPVDGIQTICLSGSAADRFPSKEIAGRSTYLDMPNYVYIGQRVGSNLLSKKLPVESLVFFAIDPRLRNHGKWEFFSRAFNCSMLEPKIDFELMIAKALQPSSRGKSIDTDFFPIKGFLERCAAAVDGKGIVRASVSPANARYILNRFGDESFVELEEILKNRKSIKFSLGVDGASTNDRTCNAIQVGLRCDLLSLRAAFVTPKGADSSFSVFDLSSGEFQMLITLLALGFCVEDGSVVLLDEPENSLHPQWQRELMTEMNIIIDRFTDGHLIISTHSPLILSGASSNASIVNLEQLGIDALPTSFSFGASADGILLENFGIASSRNPYVSNVIQRAVDLTSQGEGAGEELDLMSVELSTIRSSLKLDDPLVLIIDALLE